MSFYNKKDFIREMSEYSELYRYTFNVQGLCDSLCEIRMSAAAPSWTKFQKKVRNCIDDYFSSRGITAEYPPVPQNQVDDMNNVVGDIDQVRDVEGVIDYLTKIKDYSVENNLKRLFLFSQNEENEHFNYFAALFYALSQTRAKVDKTSFICLYAQTLLTQKITRKMLCFLVGKYGLYCRNCSDSEMFGSERKNFENLRNRESILRLAHRIHLSDPDDRDGAMKRSGDMLKNYLSADDYNPRNFYEMILYYSVYYDLSADQTDKMICEASAFAAHKIFGEIDIDDIRRYLSTVDIQELKEFLDFDKDSIGVLHGLTKSAGIAWDRAALKENVKKVLENMGVYRDVNVLRSQSTYGYFEKSVEPTVRKLDPEKNADWMKNFCHWMAEEKRFYEGYFYEGSYSRSIYRYSLDMTDPTDVAAYKIVYNHVLHVEGVKGYDSLNKELWKKDVRNCGSNDKMAAKVKKYIIPRLRQIDDYITSYCNREISEEKVSQKMLNLNDLRSADIDRGSLCYRIVELLKDEQTGEVDRTQWMKELFDQFASDQYYYDPNIPEDERKESAKEGAQEFVNSVMEDAEKLRFAGFDPYRFEDALFYLCLRTADPQGMFDTIVSMDGFEYNS